MAVDYDLGTARGKIEIDSSQLGRTSEALRTMGRSMVAIGGLAAAGFIVAVKSAADFEKQISAVAAVSQASQVEVEALRQLALELGSTTVYSAGEIAGAMEALAKAGIPVQDMLDGATQATINLAAAAGDELPGGVERAAEIISNAQKTFNASAEDLEHFADSLVGAAASSTLSVEDLATSFRYAGPIAAQLGLSIDDLNTVLAILGDRGIKGSTAGTSLRGVLLSLTPTSARAKEAMKDLGLITADGANQFYDLHGNLKPIPEVMQLLGNATKDLSEQEKVAAFNAIFQRRAMNAALILAEQGEQGFRNYADAIGELSAADIAATKLDNLSGDVTILKNSLNALLIRAGQPFQDMMRDWVQGLTDLVQKISELDPEILRLVMQILGIGGATLIAMGGMLLLMSGLIRAYRTIIIFKEAVGLLTAAMKLLTISFLTNPVVLIVAALVALGAILYLAYRRSETFREAVDTLFDKFQPTIEKVVGWVQNFVSLLDDLWRAFQGGGIEGDAFSGVLEKMGLNSEQVVGALIWLRDTLITMRDAAVTAFDYFADVILPTLIDVGYAIYNGIGTAIDWLTTTAIPAIVRFGQTVGDIAMSVARWFNDHVVPALQAFGDFAVAVGRIVGEAFQALWPIITFLGDVIFAVVRFIVDLLDDFVQGVLQVWNYLGDNLIELVIIAWDFIVGILKGAFEIIQGIFQVFAGILTLNWSQVWTGLGNILGGAWQLIVQLLQTGWELIRLIFETFVDLIVLIWKLLWDLVPAILSGAWDLLFEILNGAVQLFISLWEMLASVVNFLWDGLWQLVANILAAAWRGIIETIARNVASVIARFLAFQGEVIAVFINAVSWLLQAGRNIVQGLLNGVIETGLRLAQWFIDLPGNVLELLGDLGDLLYDVGIAIIQGLIEGVGSMAQAVADKVEGVVAGAKNAAERFLGIGSPSKVFREYGENVIQGFVQGLSDTADVRDQMAQLAAISNGNDFSLASAGMSKNDNSVTFNLTLNGVSNPEEFREVLSDSDFVDDVLSAVKAGRR